jgi:hypothetical protein
MFSLWRETAQHPRFDLTGFYPSRVDAVEPMTELRHRLVSRPAANRPVSSFCLRLQPTNPGLAEKSHPLNSAAQVTTILNDVPSFSVGDAFLELHCLLAYNAANEIDQRAFIVVQT